MGVFTPSSYATKTPSDLGTDLGGQRWEAVGVIQGSMLRQQGSPQPGVLSCVLSGPAAGVGSWRAGLGLSLPLCPQGTQHMVADIMS